MMGICDIRSDSSSNVQCYFQFDDGFMIFGLYKYAHTFKVHISNKFLRFENLNNKLPNPY